MLSKDKHAYKVILEKKVKEEIDKIAKEQDRSVSWLVNSVLKKYLAKKKAP